MSKSTIRRHPERAVPSEVAEIMSAGLVAHVGFSIDGQPYVIPFIYHFEPAEPARLYLHGSPEGRAIQHLTSGAPVCVTVTVVDGLVYSRDAKTHSMNYRSAVCFGTGRLIEDDEEKWTIFQRQIARHFAGRSAPRDYARPTREQLHSTSVIEIRIEEWSAKARRGGPKGPRDSQPEAPGTCGVVELGGGSLPARTA